MTQRTAPEVSIALTTYNRPKFLNSCIRSILGQSFSNFEILIGNDYTDVPVTPETLGLTDDRITIFNHTSSLGEINNINFLLNSSRGRYFTCIADDDCLFPDFLKTTIRAMNDTSNPSVVFTDYFHGTTFPDTMPLSSPKPELRIGGTLFTDYVTRQIGLIGVGGLFKREFLIALGGVPDLGHCSPYSDVFLALKCSLTNSLAYVPERLYFLRTHKGSISFSSTDSDVYLTAQKTLIADFLPMIEKEKSRKETREVLVHLINWFASDYRRVLRRSGLNKLKGRGALMIPHMFRAIAHRRLMQSPLLMFKAAAIDLRHLKFWIKADLSAQVVPKLLSRPKNPMTKGPMILPRWLCK